MPMQLPRPGAVLLLAALANAPSARAQKKDYLTDAEADKIRDAETPSLRIRLFISFASMRIDKLKYEFAHPEDSLNRPRQLGGDMDRSGAAAIAAGVVLVVAELDPEGGLELGDGPGQHHRTPSRMPLDHRQAMVAA